MVRLCGLRGSYRHEVKLGITSLAGRVVREAVETAHVEGQHAAREELSTARLHRDMWLCLPARLATLPDSLFLGFSGALQRAASLEGGGH